MNKRIVSMIRKLSNTEQEISLTELAEEFQISQRTVRNDLNAINDLLTEQTLANIRLGKGGKILRQKDFPEILKSLDEKDFYDYKLSKEERKKIASVLLVTVSGYITLSEIAEHMAVSRATVINDLDEIKIYIHKGNLEVQSHPNKGLSVKGSESDRRVFLLGLVNYNPDAAREDIVQKQIAVNEEQNALIGKILSEQEHVHECFLSDSSFQKIQIYLEIMAKRLEQGCMIEPRRKKDNSKYAMAEDILKYVSQYCSVKINEDEVQFLSELLTFGRYMKQKHADPDSVKIQMITRGFIEKISDTLGTVLTQDYDFFENLSKHLESTITAGNMINEKNPVIENVVEENPEIYKAVKANLSMLEDYAGRALTDAETGYIVVHVCAAVERKKNQEISFRVIVACHAGIGTSRLLLERLKKHFNFRIVDIVSSHEAGNLKEDQADLVISTVPLKSCAIEMVVVSPLLKDEDYIEIGNKLERLQIKKLKKKELQTEKLEGETVASTTEIPRTPEMLLQGIGDLLYERVPEEAEELIQEIQKKLAVFFQTDKVTEEGYTLALGQLLTETHIRLDVECKDWRQAVQASAETLLHKGYIKDSYIDAMIHNIEENGPYIVLTKGFAVPHEGIDKGVYKTGMSLIRLKDPVNFDAEENDPVEFVCCMCATDHKTHLRAFFNLVNMLKTPGFLKSLQETTTLEETAEVIRHYEKMAERKQRKL